MATPENRGQPPPLRCGTLDIDAIAAPLPHPGRRRGRPAQCKSAISRVARLALSLHFQVTRAGSSAARARRRATTKEAVMRFRSAIVAALAGLVLGTVAGAAIAGDPTTRYSGTVVEFDRRAGVLVLEEVGPWRVVDGKTVVERRTIRLTDSTTFRSFIRVNAPGHYQGDFIEVALDAGDVTLGDFVTVTGRRTGNEITALGVAIAEVKPW
jgi:hypothetical protein